MKPIQKKLLAFLTPIMVLVSSCCDDQNLKDVEKQSLEEGLFVAKQDATMVESVENGFIITKIPAERVGINEVVLRADTDNPQVYWVEISMNKMVDAGDGYMFRLGAVNYRDFKNRGGHWVLKFVDLNKAREFLRKLAKVYELTKENVIDHTVQ